MWGTNDNFEVRRVSEGNPYVGYLAYEQKQKKSDIKEATFNDNDGVELSRELRRLKPEVEEIHDGHDEKGQGEEKEKGKEEKEDNDGIEVIDEIDERMMALLSGMIDDEAQKSIVAENFDLVKAHYLQRVSGTIESMKPSLIVLKLLSGERRLHEELQEAFGNLYGEYLSIENSKLKSPDCIRSAWQQALGINNLTQSA